MPCGASSRRAPGCNWGGLGWLKTNPFSSSKNVIDAFASQRLIHPQPSYTASEKKCKVTVQPGIPAMGDLCMVRGGSTGYRHTTLLHRVRGGRAHVLEGNVKALAWLTGYVGINLGLARPGSYPLNSVVFIRTA